MRIKKEDRRRRIVQAATREFFRCGYDKASLRKIAETLDMSHGNIRNYFRNKQSLFEAVVSPALIYLDEVLNRSLDYTSLSRQELMRFMDVNHSIEANLAIFTFVMEHREIFEILWYRSQPSYYRRLRDKCIQSFVSSSEAFIRALTEQELIEEKPLTDLFKHSLASLFVVSIEEIIKHKPDSSTLKQYAEELATFTHYGSFRSVQCIRRTP